LYNRIAKGNDPKTGKRINTFNDITLREVLQRFLEIKPIRTDTQRNYHFAINRHFNDWLDMPITSITKGMVEQRHHELTVSPNRLVTSGHGRANNALKKVSALINFASDRYGTEDEPLIKTNPVSRLSRNRSWHRIYPRQGIIPDHKLKDWYRAVSTLQNEVARDFMTFLLLTDMRFGETRKLKWSHVDFENKILIVPRELTKSDREHRLPFSDFLIALLKRPYIYRKHSEWVFQSSRLKDKHLSGGVGIVRRVRAKSGINSPSADGGTTGGTGGAGGDGGANANQGAGGNGGNGGNTGSGGVITFKPGTSGTISGTGAATIDANGGNTAGIGGALGSGLPIGKIGNPGTTGLGGKVTPGTITGFTINTLPGT
jgi:integrase